MGITKVTYFYNISSSYNYMDLEVFWWMNNETEKRYSYIIDLKAKDVIYKSDFSQSSMYEWVPGCDRILASQRGDNPYIYEIILPELNNEIQCKLPEGFWVIFCKKSPDNSAIAYYGRIIGMDDLVSLVQRSSIWKKLSTWLSGLFSKNKFRESDNPNFCLFYGSDKNNLQKIACHSYWHWINNECIVFDEKNSINLINIKTNKRKRLAIPAKFSNNFFPDYKNRIFLQQSELKDYKILNLSIKQTYRNLHYLYNLSDDSYYEIKINDKIFPLSFLDNKIFFQVYLKDQNSFKELKYYDIEKDKEFSVYKSDVNYTGFPVVFKDTIYNMVYDKGIFHLYAIDYNNKQKRLVLSFEISESNFNVNMI